MVDFLLFLKRRTGPPLDLPSHYSASKLASEQNFRAAAAATSLAAASVTNLAAVSSSGSPFAGMSSTSPYAASVESRSGEFTWDPRRSTLQKLRDPVLMANFTCNEAVMIQLLDERYFEYLENMALNTSEQSDNTTNTERRGRSVSRVAAHSSLFYWLCLCSAETSMLPPLLMSLLRMDYNSGLVRAVVDKILTNQVQFDGFIPPLMALARDGTSHNTISCLRCLTMLAREFPEVIFDYGGVTLAMWHICTAKHEDLLESALGQTQNTHRQRRAKEAQNDHSTAYLTVLFRSDRGACHWQHTACIRSTRSVQREPRLGSKLVRLSARRFMLRFSSCLLCLCVVVFIRKLVDLLRLRVGQQLRYRPAVLQKTCELMLSDITQRGNG